MFHGVLIAESLRAGTTFDGPPLAVRKITRSAPESVTARQPAQWTLIEFEVAEEEAAALAERLAELLDEGPGWYADFHSTDESFVVFPGRIFRYPRGDRGRRSEAEGYGRSISIPDAQLDWPM